MTSRTKQSAPGGTGKRSRLTSTTTADRIPHAGGICHYYGSDALGRALALVSQPDLETLPAELFPSTLPHSLGSVCKKGKKGAGVS
jgi:hypothetical protein